MPHTNLTPDAVRRLRQGATHLRRDELLSIEGDLRPGETVELRDAEDRLLGVGDVEVDSQGAVGVRRLGTLNDKAEGLIPRQLRRAMSRRAEVVDDPRYCRVVNEEGDGLPGLVIDRFDGMFAVQTTSRAMDARIDEISRALVEIGGARAIILRNDTPRRERAGLARERSSRVLYGSPPRWMRIQELGARLTIDLHLGFDTGYSYALREVRRTVGKLARNARVLDPSCAVGGTIIQAGLGGARQILAFSEDADAVDLARENMEANGLHGRSIVREGSPMEALQSVHENFDLVLLHAPVTGIDLERWSKDLGELIRLSLRATRHGGRMLVVAPGLALGADSLEDHVVHQCELEGRAAYRLLRPAAPADFPAVAATPDAVRSVLLEIA